MRSGLLIIGLALCISLFAEGVAPSGAGTEGDPYRVTCLENILWMSTTPTSWSGNFIQVEDINASDTKDWNDGAGFIPIGSENDPFSGCYDGQNHVIDSLNIHRASEERTALFGNTEQSVISNLGLTALDE